MRGFSSGSADDFTARLRGQLDAGRRGASSSTCGTTRAASSTRHVTIASQFIAIGPIYWEEYADGDQVPHEAQPGGVATDPASRSWCWSTAARRPPARSSPGRSQDTGRATLVGETTFGKGTVQQWHLLLRRQRRLPPLGRQVADARQDLDPRRRHDARRPGPEDRRAGQRPAARPRARVLAAGRGVERRRLAGHPRALARRPPRPRRDPESSQAEPSRTSCARVDLFRGIVGRERKEVMCSDRQ